MIPGKFMVNLRSEAMSGQYNAAMMHVLGIRIADWAPVIGFSQNALLRPVSTDLTFLTTIADRVFVVEDPHPSILHLEPHAWPDDDLDIRELVYRVLIRRKLPELLPGAPPDTPIRSTVILLHRAAWTAKNKGYVREQSPDGSCAIDFRYEVIRVWELPPETFLEGGPGLLPVAPLSKVSRKDIPKVIARMKERLAREVPRAEAAELSTAAFLLMGLRFNEDDTYRFLQPLRQIMLESPTYQALVNEGEVKGIEKGLERGKRETLLLLGTRRFGKPTAKVRKRLEATHDAAALDSLAIRLLDATSWKELLEDLPAT